MISKSFALITGASTGLGKHLAHECALKGFPLILVALPGTGLERAAKDLRKHTGVEVHFVEADLTDESGPVKIFNFCTVHSYHVGLLINNAGVGLESSFESVPLSFCTSLMQLNTLAVVKMTGLFLPHLKTAKDAHILNVSSLASYTPMPFKGIYSASKAFINSFSCSLRTELKGTGISISVLCPGGIPTNDVMRRRINNHGWFARAGMMEPDKLAHIAITQMFKGKQVIIPGRINRISKFLMSIVPSGLQQEILYRSYFKKVEVKLEKLPVMLLEPVRNN